MSRVKVLHQRHPDAGTVCHSTGNWTWVTAEVTCRKCLKASTPALLRRIREARQTTLFDMQPSPKAPRKPRRLPCDDPKAVHSELVPLAFECKRFFRTDEGIKQLGIRTSDPLQVTCVLCAKALEGYPQLVNQMLLGSPA